MARFGLGGVRLTNSLGLNLAVCELRDKCRSLHFLACRWESGPRYRGVYELHIHARLFCPRGGALLRQLKLVRTPGPGSLTVLGVGPPTPWKLACTTTNGWFQKGNVLADRMR